MPRSTYISENLTTEQLAFLRALDDKEVDFFSLFNIENLIDQKVENLNEVVENLASKGLLDRIERGKYTRPNFKDPYVIGTFIAPGNSAIAYWTALHLYNLTDRFPERIFVKTVSRKKSKRIFGVLYQFVFISEDKFTGVTIQGYGNLSYPITDREMTLIDCFDQPRYGGAFPDLIKAFAQSASDAQKLIDYSKATGNISVIKRLGFLAELLEKSALDSFVEFALSMVNRRYTLLDPHGNDDGEFNSRWKLRLNVASDDIISIINSPY